MPLCRSWREVSGQWKYLEDEEVEEERGRDREFDVPKKADIARIHSNTREEHAKQKRERSITNPSHVAVVRTHTTTTPSKLNS